MKQQYMVQDEQWQTGSSRLQKTTVLPQEKMTNRVSIVIYVAGHCPTCAYSYEVAEMIRQEFPAVNVRLVDLATTSEQIPDDVFATPTYLLNGRLWSLGNPSPETVTNTLIELMRETE